MLEALYPRYKSAFATIAIATFPLPSQRPRSINFQDITERPHKNLVSLPNLP